MNQRRHFIKCTKCSCWNSTFFMYFINRLPL